MKKGAISNLILGLGVSATEQSASSGGSTPQKEPTEEVGCSKYQKGRLNPNNNFGD